MMIQVVKQNDSIVKYLQKDRRVNLNVLSYLAYNMDADVYIYNDNAENGVIVGTGQWSFFFAATQNEEFLNAFWEFLPAGHKMFSGASRPVFDIMTATRKPVWQMPCKTFIYDGVTPIPDATSSFILETLTADDAEEIDKYYTYRSEGSVNRLRESIEKRDSTCIRIDGQLASWCLVHAEDGSLGPLYTKEEFRGRGLAEAATAHLMKQLVAKNMTPYAQIAEDNAPSLALMAKFGGMEYSHTCVWFGLEKS